MSTAPAPDGTVDEPAANRRLLVVDDEDALLDLLGDALRFAGYDVDVAAADQEVDAEIAGLKAKGAQKIFVAGHSQGGVFALHYGSVRPVDGVIAIAPGGHVGSQAFRQRVVDETPPDAVDAAGWLALCRPSGWEAAVEAIGRTRGDRAVSEEAEKRLRELQRSLSTSETKRQHAEGVGRWVLPFDGRGPHPDPRSNLTPPQ